MLLQVWTDFGDPQVTPDRVVTPVVVLPPLFKMLPGELRGLRLMLSSRDGLPDDRRRALAQYFPDSADEQ
jgi:P pilus assembly chaperone PapD